MRVDSYLSATISSATLVALRFDTLSSGASFLTGDPAVRARLLK